MKKLKDYKNRQPRGISQHEVQKKSLVEVRAEATKVSMQVKLSEVKSYLCMLPAHALAPTSQV